MTDNYRWIRGFPGYDTNPDVSDVRSYWTNGLGSSIAKDPVRSLLPQRKGPRLYYRLRADGHVRSISQAVIRDLAFGEKSTRSARQYQPSVDSEIRREAIMRAAKTDPEIAPLAKHLRAKMKEQRKAARISEADMIWVLGRIGMMLMEAD